MDWVKTLLARADKDPQYQNYLMQTLALEDSYNTILNDLSDDQKQLLEQYITACENMDHALIALAYQLGKENTAGEK